MKRTLSAAALCGSLLLSSFGIGCNNNRDGTSKGDSGGATAVVDLDKVARDLGWQAKLQSNLETYKTQLQADVKNYDGKYSEQIQREVKGMIPPNTKADDKYTLTPAQSQQLSNLISAGRQQLGQVAQSGNEYFGRYRMEWVKQYREALSPIIRSVAEDKKVNVVISEGDQVLFADRTIDLTDAVVDAARKQPPALTEVPMTHIDAPQTINVGATPPVGGSTTQPATTQP